MNTFVDCFMFTFGQNANRISIVKFQLDPNNHQVMYNTYGIPLYINLLEQQLNNITAAAVHQDMTEPLCAFLEWALDLIPLPGNGESREKLAVMIIDGTIRLGADPEILANEFKRRGIILVVLALGRYVFEIWDFYRELARNSGGEYMLMQDAPYILERAISSAITEEDTLRQAFLHTTIQPVANMANDTDNMNEQNEITDGVRDMLF